MHKQKPSHTPDLATPTLLDGAYGRLLGAAIDAVYSASLVCRTVQAELVSEDTYTKKDRSPVTVADFSAQAIVSRLLQRQFPSIPLVGEESAAALRSSSGAVLREQVTRHVTQAFASRGEDITPSRVLDAIDAGNDRGGASGQRWVLDPIDGTKGYLRRQQYAVALALLDDGVPVLGVLGCPAMDRSPDAALDAKANTENGCLFIARRGQGVYETGIRSQRESAQGPWHPAELLEGAQRLSATNVEDPGDAIFCESVEAAHSSHDRHSAIAKHLGVTKPSFRIDSQCKYAAVARGEASIYLRLPTSATYREKIWDHAAGWAVVTEAGGRVTDIHGKRLDFSLGRTLDHNRGVVVTNDLLHDTVLAAINATGSAADRR